MEMHPEVSDIAAIVTAGGPMDKAIQKKPRCPTSRVQVSEYLPQSSKYDGDITLFQQFYIPDSQERRDEVNSALYLNANNASISRIVLLTERFFTPDELGIGEDHTKVVQEVIGHRMRFSDVWDYIENNGIKGYVAVAHADIFFDRSIEECRSAMLHTTPCVVALTRHEYSSSAEGQLDASPLFSRCPERCQDSWIWHTEGMKTPSAKKRQVFDIPIGILTAGSGNAYLFGMAGATLYNDPKRIRTYHMHQSGFRADQERFTGNVSFIFPAGLIGSPGLYAYRGLSENERLAAYLKCKMDSLFPFVVPRVGGIENEAALLGAHMAQSGRAAPEQQEAFAKMVPLLKSRAGIAVRDIHDVCRYADMYLKAFVDADAHFTYSPLGKTGAQAALDRSLPFIDENFKHHDKFDACSLDALAVVARNEPWTLTLKGLRILVVSPVIRTIERQVNSGARPYGFDLFPNCSFTYLKPPQTQGDIPSTGFGDELAAFQTRVSCMTSSFDVALVSAGGYANPICAIIHDLGKSAINMGGVLQMYFGVYGGRWLSNSREGLRMYFNEDWVRPSADEAPAVGLTLEAADYW